MAPTLTNLHDEFLAEQRYASRRAASTLRGYRQSFALLTALMPGLQLEQLTPQTMAEFFRRLDSRRRLVGRGHERRGVKASTIATHRSKLGRYLAWLTAHGHLRENPFASMPYPRVEYEGRQYLSRSAIDRIFASLVLAAPQPNAFLRQRNRAILALFLFAGLRRGELLGLRVHDINLDRAELHVRSETSKSRHARVIPINSSLHAILADHLAERSRRPLATEFLLTSSTGTGPLTQNGLKHLVQRVQRQAGVRFHVHQLRHTFAVNFLNRGGDVVRLKQLLGHRDIRVTSSYLRHLPTSAMRDGVECLTLDTLL